MRISNKEIEVIKKLAVVIFGEGTKVLLFGSRTDDRMKGGDIDLLISNNQESQLTLSAKIKFITELKLIIGDQKIDVVLDSESTRKKKSFYHSIKQQAVEI